MHIDINLFNLINTNYIDSTIFTNKLGRFVDQLHFHSDFSIWQNIPN